MQTEFEFDGRKLKVRAEADPDNARWVVRVVENGKPVTLTYYTVTYDVAVDAKLGMDVDAVKDLMATAQRSIENGWDRLI